MIKAMDINPSVSQHWKQSRFGVYKLYLDTSWGIDTVPVLGPICL